MKREEKLVRTLRKLIEQTDKAVEEGWIYSDKFREKLDEARKELPDSKKTKDTYPSPSLGFHIVKQ